MFKNLIQPFVRNLQNTANKIEEKTVQILTDKVIEKKFDQVKQTGYHLIEIAKDKIDQLRK